VFIYHYTFPRHIHHRDGEGSRGPGRADGRARPVQSTALSPLHYQTGDSRPTTRIRKRGRKKPHDQASRNPKDCEGVFPCYTVSGSILIPVRSRISYLTRYGVRERHPEIFLLYGFRREKTTAESGLRV